MKKAKHLLSFALALAVAAGCVPEASALHETRDSILAASVKTAERARGSYFYNYMGRMEKGEAYQAL